MTTPATPTAERLWVKHPGEIAYLDDGFVPAPGSLLSGYSSTTQPLSDLDAVSCLVLIGEPGAGKSTALDAEAQRLRRQHSVHWVSLGSTREESTLRHKIFEAKVWSDWVEGAGTLTLLLDALDEAVVEHAADLIMEGLGEAPVDRLSVRITCRTTRRVPALEKALEARFESGLGERTTAAFGVYELLPLSKPEVLKIAADRGVEGSQFLKAVLADELQQLAMTPITLKMLLDEWEATQELGSDRTTLYEEGCLRLCEDLAGRARGKRTGNLSDSERLAVAARIAAATTLSGRTAIRLDERAGGPDAASVADLKGGRATDTRAGGEATVEVTADAVLEVLNTGLFSARGDDHVGFVHATFEEYLCAYFIANGGLARHQVEELLLSETPEGLRVVPQLRGTAIWLAQLDGEFRSTLITRDPTLLLQGAGFPSLTEEDRVAVFDGVLAAIERREISRWQLSLRAAGEFLTSAGVIRRLKTILPDKDEDDSVREAACDAAGAIASAELVNPLRAVALDDSDDVGVRVSAVTALARFASVSSLREIKLLATSPQPIDRDDELKGAALRGLWPRVLTTEDVLPALTEPKRRNLFGLYRGFLQIRFPDEIGPQDLPSALRWAAALPVTHDSSDGLSDLRDQLLVKSFGFLDDDQVTTAAVAVLEALLRERVSWISNSALRGSKRDLSAEVRHALVSALIERPDEAPADPAGLAVASPQLVTAEDMSWLLERLAESEASAEARYAELIAALVLRTSADPAPVLEARELSEALRHETAGLFEAIPLDSERATQLKESYYNFERLRQEEPERPVIDVSARVTAALDLFESDDPEAKSGYWQALFWLEVDAGRNIRDTFEANIEALPGWQLIDDETRARVIAGSRAYLRRGDPDAERWFGTDTLHAFATAGYRAMRHLYPDRGIADVMNGPLWDRWVPAIVGWPQAAGDDDGFEVWAIGQAHEHARTSTVKFLVRRLDRDLRRHSTPFTLQRFGTVWGPELEAAVLKRAKSSSRAPAVRAELLSYLIRHGSTLARNHAERLVTRAAVRAGGKRLDLAVRVGAVLAVESDDAYWGQLWPLILDDDEFGRRLVSQLANGREHFLGSRLTESQVGRLYEWMMDQFPPDPETELRSGYVTESQEVAHFRNRLPAGLAERGTAAAVHELERLAAIPRFAGLRAYVAQAAEQVSRNNWIAPSPDVIVKMADNVARRWVRSGNDLRQVVVAALCEAGKTIQDGAANTLWNTSPQIRPKLEGALSDFLQRELEGDLRGRGIVCGRELQVTPAISQGLGESADIWVTALAGERTQNAPQVEVIVEVKCCWNKELDTSLRDQLGERYLLPGTRDDGVYLVGWYDAPGWDAADKPKRNPCRKRTVNGLRKQFEKQAVEVSADLGLRIDAVVLDCSLKEPRNKPSRKNTAKKS